MKPSGYWENKEHCLEEARKYQYRSVLKKENNTVYKKLSERGWLEEACSHMNYKCKPVNYWTIERCKEVAKKYKTKKEFQNKNNSVYTTCVRQGWIDDVCGHMEIIGNRFKRIIYSYEFIEDKSVYVGLTYNMKIRQFNRDRYDKDQVTKYIKKTGFKPIRRLLTDYIEVEEAIKLEGFYVKKYKNEGWNILNVSKTGAIGNGYKKWTYELVKSITQKYNTLTLLKKDYENLYYLIRNRKWFELVEHMSDFDNEKKIRILPKKIQKPKLIKEKPVKIIKPKIVKEKKVIEIKWNKEACREAALKSNNLKDFNQMFPGAYAMCNRHEWIDEIAPHLRKNKERNYWSKENCYKVAKTCLNRRELADKNMTVYNKARKNKWLDEFFPIVYKNGFDKIGTRVI